MKGLQRKINLIIMTSALSVSMMTSITMADGNKSDKNKKPLSEVTLLAVGDDLIHDTVYKSAKSKKGYNFNPIFKNTKKYVQKSDLSIINQETILVNSHYSGYPAFGSPKQVGDAVVSAGFDVVTQATNHALDRGTSNIAGTCRYWHQRHPQITLLGIHNSQQDAHRIRIVKRNGIRIAMLNYTYGLNGLRLPRGKQYMVDELINPGKIRKDIRKAKKQSDFVIIFPHWGIEYKYQPSADQKRWAKLFADEGADLVIGTHPHVLEPCTTIKGKNGHKTVVYYSLGNFVSAQRKPDRMLGGMAQIKIVRDHNGVHISDYSLQATITHITKHYRSFRVYKLDDYSNKLAKANYLSGGTTVSHFKSIYRKATGHNYPYTKKSTH